MGNLHYLPDILPLQDLYNIPLTYILQILHLDISRIFQSASCCLQNHLKPRYVYNPDTLLFPEGTGKEHTDYRSFHVRQTLRKEWFYPLADIPLQIQHNWFSTDIFPCIQESSFHSSDKMSQFPSHG